MSRESWYQCAAWPLWCLLLAALCFPAWACAYSEEVVTASDGKPMFAYRYYDAGEYWVFDTQTQQSFTTLNADLRGELRRAGEFWANILGPQATNAAPIPFVVGTYEAENADATSLMGMYGGINASLILLQITQGHAIPVEAQASGQIRIGQLSWYIAPHPSNLPQNGMKAETFSVMTHELMHALGVNVYAGIANDGEARMFAFSEDKTNYIDFLFDKNGTQAKPGMLVGFEAIPGEDVFILDAPEPETYGAGQAYFQGSHVHEAIGKAKLGTYGINGLPLRGFELTADQGWSRDDKGGWIWVQEDGLAPELSHVELDNSLMSHFNWRNYLYYMEAELALLQDLGYSFDRKNNFGDSVYESDLSSWASRHGYSARTADGTGWIANAYNGTSYGVGLHVYGGKNTLTQRHDILSSGVAGTGIRMDGVENTLTIALGTRVHAVGDYSTGLLLAYGKNHHIIHRGDIAATGQGGIGIQLDFGDNVLGNNTEMRGSYIYASTNPEDMPGVKEGLSGPLARALDITGRVRGQAAAIYVAPNAYVQEINIMRGADLSGDIVSRWDPNAPAVTLHPSQADLTTTLAFGRAPDSQGGATANADAAFSMNYMGNIFGEKSVHMHVAGGRLSFNGTASVLSVLNEGTLMGNAQYTLFDSTKAFTNAGVLAPGNSIGLMTITGGFTQTASGRLEMEFTPSGSDRLAVSGLVQLDGTLSLRPSAAYYTSGETLHLDTLFDFSGSAPSTQFAQVESVQPLSPTLHASITPAADTLTATAQISRLPNAYARFAASGNGVRQGKALQGFADAATGDMQALLAALDFSAQDGSDIRRALPQLSPAPYAMVAQASAEANLSMARMALAHLRAARPAQEKRGVHTDDAVGIGSEQWSAWVMPFGGIRSQQSHQDLPAYDDTQAGLMGGVYRQSGDLTAGLYAAFSHRKTEIQTEAGAKSRSDALHLGAEGLWRPQGDAGWYAWGQVQAGVETTDMRRKLAFSGYTRESQSDWLGFSGTASAGSGWEWRIGDFTFGPHAGLEYALNVQPQIEEWGGQAARLQIDAFTRHDLRGVAGLSLAWCKALPDQRSVQAHVGAQWRQELLPRERDMRSHFVGYGAHGFTTTIERQGRGSLGLNGAVQVDVRQDMTLSAQVDADVLRQGYTNVGAGLSLRWEF